MKDALLVINASVLLACASMYLGTGWSLVLFSFPIGRRLTPETYRLPFVEPVTNATRFFTWMTIVMIVAAIVMLVDEWGDGYMAVPLVFLGALAAATALTLTSILPLNRRMNEGITEQPELDDVLKRWMAFNRVRVALWTVEWAAIMVWFAGRVAD